MSFKALTLAASIFAAFATPSFAGSTTALDIDPMTKPMSDGMMGPATMTAEKASVAATRSAKVEQILKDCEFVNTKRDSYCTAFKQSNL